MPLKKSPKQSKIITSETPKNNHVTTEIRAQLFLCVYISLPSHCLKFLRLCCVQHWKETHITRQLWAEAGLRGLVRKTTKHGARKELGWVPCGCKKGLTMLTLFWRRVWICNPFFFCTVSWVNICTPAEGKAGKESLHELSGEHFAHINSVPSGTV